MRSTTRTDPPDCGAQAGPSTVPGARPRSALRPLRRTAPAAGSGAAPSGPAHQQRLVNRPMAMMLAITFGALSAFYLLASAVPLYVADAGGGGAGAGLATGALMLSTVALELATPRLLARFGYRAAIAAGLVLLGVPTIALTFSSAMPLVLGVCLARGAGLGIFFVAGIALAAELLPADRRGEGLGLYGAVSSVPSIVCLPLGIWLGREVSYDVVFLGGAAAALLPLVFVAALPSRSSRPAPGAAADPHAAGTHHGGIVAGLRNGGLVRPSVIFLSVTLAMGAIMTFLPLAVSPGAVHIASAGLLLQSITTPIARWWAGRHGDRRGHAHLLLPGIGASALGAAALFWVGSPLAVLAGMAAFGVGFGIALNSTQALMFSRVGPEGFGQVSALWSLAYDGGLGIGALGLGLVVGRIGYPAGFALAAAGIAATALAWWYDARATTRVRG